MAGAPRFALLFCGTQFGWASQLPTLFPPRSSGAAAEERPVLRVPSFHVIGEQDAFRPTVRPPDCACGCCAAPAEAAVAQTEVLARLWADTDASTGAQLRHVVTHPSGHRPLPPGREDAAAVVSAARTFLLSQQQTLTAAPAG